MKVTYCDACGKEAGNARTVAIPCHLYSKRDEIGFVDSGMNRVSGRDDHLDLCNACRNQAYSAMVDKVLSIQQAAKRREDQDDKLMGSNMKPSPCVEANVEQYN